MSLQVREQVQKEALDAVLPFRRAGLHISMGVGKTYIGLQYISRVGGKVLVVAPKVTIFKSWKDDAVKFGLSHLLKDISFSTYISLTKQEPGDYDVIILDEAHNTKGSHDLFLHMFGGRVLGLTGTPPKYKYGEKGIMMSEYYPIKYSYGVDDAVEEEILNDYRIYIHSLPLGVENNYKVGKGDKTFYTSEVKNYSWHLSELEKAFTDRQIFLKRIMQLNALKSYKTKLNFCSYVMSKIPQEEKLLVFANTTEQAEYICKDTHHSKNHKKENESTLELFSSGQITRLSAVEQLSEGITVPHLKHILIMHSYGNEKKASQKIGRALRLNKDEIANVHILCYKNTIDETWVSRAVEDFDKEKIKWINWDYQQGQYKRLQEKLLT